jgi:hypothetical protein
MKYYPARLAESYSDYETALRAIGVEKDDAEKFIANAQIEQSQSIFVRINGDKGVTLTKSMDGTVQVWQACINELFESPNKAKELATQIDQALKGGPAAGSTWAVFEWTEPPSRKRH